MGADGAVRPCKIFLSFCPFPLSPPAGYFLSLAKESNQRTPFKGRGISISLSPKKTPHLETTKGEGCGPPLWKHHPGKWAIIKSRLCRGAAKVGGGLWPLVWKVFLPLVDVRRERDGQTAGGVPQGHSFRFAPQRRTPPLHTKYRTAQLCISEQKRQRKEKQRQCNI